MPVNYDGIFELRFEYFCGEGVGTVLRHRLSLDVRLSNSPDPGTPFDDILVLNWEGSENDLTAYVNALILLLRPLFNLTTDFTTVELWKYPSTGTNAQWISSQAISAAGSSSSPVNLAGQATFTFRTNGGGIMRFQLMESVISGNSQVNFPTGTAAYDNLVAFLTSEANPWQGRDDTRPIVGIRLSSTQNEALYRKRFRNNG